MTTPSPKKEPVLSDAFFNRLAPVNTTPPNFDPARDLPVGFMEFLVPLHEALTPRQQTLIAKRHQALANAHAGQLPDYLPPSPAQEHWRIELPNWCADQRNQMTGPADDAELVVKMLNSGAPGVMLDLEDSNANTWEHLSQGIHNVLEALNGRLSYDDKKRQRTVTVQSSSTVILTRPRGLHLHQAGVLASGELLPASLFDVAHIAYQLDVPALQHPLCFYIPKSESSEEALWWRDLFQMIADAKKLPANSVKCMALVESHPLAYQMEEFAWNLREHILGLNLGRWDYMASLIHFNYENPEWVLPDRNTIPHNVPFFQNLRELMPEICHAHGMLAIGGMTALYPSREDPALNERALSVLAEDKKNEAASLMDGAWTGHPDQNEIAVRQFPAPNQLSARPRNPDTHPDLRPVPHGVGRRTVTGTRAAVRTVIRYRNGVLNGRGASLVDGYMEDLATDRIYRLMIAQRIKHSATVDVVDDQNMPVRHTADFIHQLFDEELQRLLREPPKSGNITPEATLREARRISEEMIKAGAFDPA